MVSLVRSTSGGRNNTKDELNFRWRAPRVGAFLFWDHGGGSPSRHKCSLEHIPPSWHGCHGDACDHIDLRKALSERFQRAQRGRLVLTTGWPFLDRVSGGGLPKSRSPN